MSEIFINASDLGNVSRDLAKSGIQGSRDFKLASHSLECNSLQLLLVLQFKYTLIHHLTLFFLCRSLAVLFPFLSFNCVCYSGLQTSYLSDELCSGKSPLSTDNCTISYSGLARKTRQALIGVVFNLDL